MTRKLGSLRRRLRRNPFLAGLPVVGFCICGTVFLTTFQGEKIDRIDMRKQTTTVKQFELEEEYRKTMEKMDIDNYELEPIRRQ